MPLWNRLKRMVRSNVGRLLPDPASIGSLEKQLEGLRKLDKQLPKLDQDLITIKGHVTFLERKLHKLQAREAELEAKVRAAAAHGPTAAASYEVDLEGLRIEVAGATQELEVARQALTRAEAVKQAFVEQKAAQLAAARQQLEAAEGGEPEPSFDDAPAPLTPSAPADKTIGGAGASKTLGEPTASKTLGDAPPPGKTIGDGAKTISDGASKTIGEPPAGKSIGPITVTPREPAKTVGPAPEQAQAPKTLGEDAPRAESAGAPDLVSELERLGELLAAGALTQDEFEAAKAKLLASG